MKSLGIVLLALLTGFVGYQYAYPRLDDWAQFQKLAEKKAATQPEQPKRIANFEPPKTSIIDPPKIEPVMVPKPEPKPEPAPAPTVVMTPPPKAEPNPDEFQPPAFPSIDEVVKGWREIPKGAFPRKVKLQKEVEFVASVGGGKVITKVIAGGEVHALSQDGENIVVAPTPTSPSHVTVALNDTDLKDVLTTAYENWKPAMVEYLRKQWEFKKNAKTNSVASNNPKLSGVKDKPERNPDGTYPLLLASMKAGQVTEITPTNIKKWGDLQLEKIGGQEYFTVIVDYVTKTMFGDFPTAAQARIRDGKVVKWIYTGSGEVVP